MSQVYLDLVDGFHIKVTPLRRDAFKLVDTEYPTILIRIDEAKYGFRKGEEIQRSQYNLFCIAGYPSGSGKIKAVAPDLSKLPGGSS